MQLISTSAWPNIYGSQAVFEKLFHNQQLHKKDLHCCLGVCKVWNQSIPYLLQVQIYAPMWNHLCAKICKHAKLPNLIEKFDAFKAIEVQSSNIRELAMLSLRRLAHIALVCHELAIPINLESYNLYVPESFFNCEKKLFAQSMYMLDKLLPKSQLLDLGQKVDFYLLNARLYNSRLFTEKELKAFYQYVFDIDRPNNSLEKMQEGSKLILDHSLYQNQLEAIIHMLLTKRKYAQAKKMLTLLEHKETVSILYREMHIRKDIDILESKKEINQTDIFSIKHQIENIENNTTRDILYIDLIYKLTKLDYFREASELISSIRNPSSREEMDNYFKNAISTEYFDKILQTCHREHNFNAMLPLVKYITNPSDRERMYTYALKESLSKNEFKQARSIMQLIDENESSSVNTERVIKYIAKMIEQEEIKACIQTHNEMKFTEIYELLHLGAFSEAFALIHDLRNAEIFLKNKITVIGEIFSTADEQALENIFFFYPTLDGQIQELFIDKLIQVLITKNKHLDCLQMINNTNNYAARKIRLACFLENIGYQFSEINHIVDLAEIIDDPFERLELLKDFLGWR